MTIPLRWTVSALPMFHKTTTNVVAERKNRRYHSGDEIDWGFGRDPDVVG